jgi:hypothetical protein
VSGLEEMSREELFALTRVFLVENAVLKVEIAQLRDCVAELERLVSRNSGNSGMPPSADDLPGRKGTKDRASGAAGQRRLGKRGLFGSGSRGSRVELPSLGMCAIVAS